MLTRSLNMLKLFSLRITGTNSFGEKKGHTDLFGAKDEKHVYKVLSYDTELTFPMLLSNIRQQSFFQLPS